MKPNLSPDGKVVMIKVFNPNSEIDELFFYDLEEAIGEISYQLSVAMLDSAPCLLTVMLVEISLADADELREVD